jgi:rubrerythrin
LAGIRLVSVKARDVDRTGALSAKRTCEQKGQHMSYDFNADEVFEMAQQMERNGAKFYRDAAENTADPSNKEMLIGLSKMEEAHEKMFATMRAELSSAEKSSAVFDPNGEAGLYLKALVDGRVFFEKEIDVTSMVEILKSAIEAEKDSIVFYLGMKAAVPKNLGSDRIEAIIKEEMGHIQMLTKHLVAQR